MVGLEKKEDGVKPELMALLALPHSASTSAMMSPPVIGSKVRREEISASNELKLVSSGTSGGSEVGEGAAFVPLPVISWGAEDSDGDMCPLLLWMGSLLSVSGLFRERVCPFGVRVMSSLMISTLLARDDIKSGLGGLSSLSSLSFDRSLTLPKRPFSPRRCRPVGCDTVWTRRSPAPLLPPLSRERKLRDLAELAEEMEVRAGAEARTPSSPSISSSACSFSPRSASCPFSFSVSDFGTGVSDNPSNALLLITGDLLFPSPLLRIENMLPGLRLPNSLNPFLIFPLGCDSLGGGSVFSVCTSIVSVIPAFFFCILQRSAAVLSAKVVDGAVTSRAGPRFVASLCCSRWVSFISCLYSSLCLSFPSSLFSSISPLKAPPLCLWFFFGLAALPGCHSN